MVVQYLDNFDKGLVKKKHRHIVELVYALIALCAIIWAIVYVQTKLVVEEEKDTMVGQDTLSKNEIALKKLQVKISESPPVTDTEREEALKNLQKEILNQNN